jgi:hypothetical protein
MACVCMLRYVRNGPFTDRIGQSRGHCRSYCIWSVFHEQFNYLWSLRSLQMSLFFIFFSTGCTAYIEFSHIILDFVCNPRPPGANMASHWWSTERTWTVRYIYIYIYIYILLLQSDILLLLFNCYIASPMVLSTAVKVKFKLRIK